MITLHYIDSIHYIDDIHYIHYIGFIHYIHTYLPTYLPTNIPTYIHTYMHVCHVIFFISFCRSHTATIDLGAAPSQRPAWPRVFPMLAPQAHQKLISNTLSTCPKLAHTNTFSLQNILPILKEEHKIKNAKQ